MSDEPFEYEESAAWNPPKSVKTHSGERIPEDAEFFVEPPESIGEIVSAETSLRESHTPKSTVTRVLLAVGISALLYFGLAVFVNSLVVNPNDAGLGNLFGAIAALIALPLTLYFTRFSHRCSFVGKQGLAEFFLKGDRKHTPSKKVLEFSQCCDVTTWQQRNYTNGIYTGTNYKYSWRDEQGTSLLVLSGNYHSENQTPKSSSPFWFANAGEIQWITYELDQMAARYESEGYVDFRVRGSDTVRVGDGYLEFHFGGKVTKLNSGDIKTLNIANGTFSIQTHEARWFSSKGKFSFEYGGMGNAKLFLYALERLAGYTFS